MFFAPQKKHVSWFKTVQIFALKKNAVLGGFLQMKKQNKYYNNSIYFFNSINKVCANNLAPVMTTGCVAKHAVCLLGKLLNGGTVCDLGGKLANVIETIKYLQSYGALNSTNTSIPFFNGIIPPQRIFNASNKASKGCKKSRLWVTERKRRLILVYKNSHFHFR